MDHTIVYGREIAGDTYGAPMIFETRLAVETFPGITTTVVGPVLVLRAWDKFSDTDTPAPMDKVEFNAPAFQGRNTKLQFTRDNGMAA